MNKLIILLLMFLVLPLTSCKKEDEIIITPPLEDSLPEIDEDVFDDVVEVIKPKDEVILKVEDFLDHIYQPEISRIKFNTYNNINQSYSLLYFIDVSDIKIDKKLVDKKYKSTRPGTLRDKIDWIVIHDTGNNKPTATGLNHAQYITTSNPGVSWHYTIDESLIYQHIPDNEVAYHAGDGLRPTGTKWYSSTYKKTNYGGGNYNGIGIETCVYNGIDYLETVVTTAKLAAKLLYQYNLPIESLKRHYDFSGKNCPTVLINSNYFKDLVTLTSYYLEAYTIFQNVEIEYIVDNELKKYISNDGIVSNEIIHQKVIDYKVKVTYNGEEYIYNYQTKLK